MTCDLKKTEKKRKNPKDNAFKELLKFAYSFFNFGQQNKASPEVHNDGLPSTSRRLLLPTHTPSLFLKPIPSFNADSVKMQIDRQSKELV